ncbi:hypothetical protein BDV29DRAFT_162810 [Aspergillus leporis]|uniref:Uncharacterized protein n=1 Tax=Aspergillus leporis TaxID=41062 RepID=A0A5N5WHN8_9EURO|nr:hypothetical protein BDV29DRAFT_162810 [Aspergillus leporis]
MCNDAVSAFDPSKTHSEQVLNSWYAMDCRSALQSREKNIKDACDFKVYAEDYGKAVPISAVPSQLNLNFKQTYLMDGDQYCNVVLGSSPLHLTFLELGPGSSF